MFQYRYWDGREWTDNVSSNGVSTLHRMGSPPAPSGVHRVGSGSFERVESREQDEAVHSHLTINNKEQLECEGVDQVSRVLRLFAESLRRLAAHPLATPAHVGTPIGDGHGMEELVAYIAPLFEHEPSLARWTAVRGGMAMLYYQTVSEDHGTPFIPYVERVMGVGHIGDIGAGDNTLGIAPDWQERLSPDQASKAVGVYSAFAMRLFDYDRISDLDAVSFVSDPACQFSNAVALDFIAWAAVAILRIEVAENVVLLPEPDLLTVPGWYTEPVFARMERYWDGDDWTNECRIRQGEHYVSGPMPIGKSS
jgi:hypothetical protein